MSLGANLLSIFVPSYFLTVTLEYDIIDSETAIERMEALKNINTRLPKDEIDKRIHSWKAKKK